jgi:hypothetical protein
MRTINYNQAQLIIDAACRTWKEKLFDKWGKAIVLKNAINISEEDYQSMRDACTGSQHDLFDDIFGKDVKFKIGDWVTYWSESEQKTLTSKIVKATASTYCVLENGKEPFYDLLKLATEEEIQKANVIPEGTPCLARDYEDDTWKFVYSNGNGKFDSGASIEMPWKYVQVLDLNNLPEYSKR